MCTVFLLKMSDSTNINTVLDFSSRVTIPVPSVQRVKACTTNKRESRPNSNFKKMECPSLSQRTGVKLTCVVFSLAFSELFQVVSKMSLNLVIYLLVRATIAQTLYRHATTTNIAYQVSFWVLHFIEALQMENIDSFRSFA